MTLRVAGMAVAAVAAVGGIVACEPAPATTHIVSSESCRNADATSTAPDISADGRYVAFSSFSPRSDCRGVFLHDRAAGETQQIASDGGSVSVSDDGQRLAYERSGDVFVRDRGARTTEQVDLPSGTAPAPPTSGGSSGPRISGNGRFVAYTSDAGLVPGDTNGVEDAFVRDLASDTTSRVSVSSTEQQAMIARCPADDPFCAADVTNAAADISADGRFVSFVSSATNMVPSDTNGVRDVFLRDLGLGTTHRNSIAADGSQLRQPSAGGALSDDGQRVSFESHDPELAATRLYLRDRAQTTTISVGEGRIGDLSGDGTAVTSRSQFAENVYRADLRSGGTSVVTVTTDGHEPTGPSFGPMTTGNGRVVAFESEASNLAPNDADGDRADIFVRTLG